MVDFATKFFSRVFNDLAGDLTLCCKSLNLLENFFLCVFKGLAGGSTPPDKSLISRRKSNPRSRSIT